MSTTVNMRLEDKHERIIIMSYLKDQKWDFEDGDWIDFIYDTYDEYEAYREWYLMLVA